MKVAEIKVPELAESITEGSIAQWVKKVGDRVEKGEFIVELETDKVNAEIISEEAGVLTQILAEEGDTVLVGQVIAVVEAGEGAAAAPAAAPTEAAPAPAAPQAAPASVAAAPVVEETSGERVEYRYQRSYLNEFHRQRFERLRMGIFSVLQQQL